MKFRLKKTDDAIELELFLKAIQAEDDYQKIRFMIKDGLVFVNGEKEYARRRLLKIGDKVSFKDRFYTISSYKGNEPQDVIKRKKELNRERYQRENPHEGEKIVHRKRLLSWSKKYNKDDDDE